MKRQYFVKSILALFCAVMYLSSCDRNNQAQNDELITGTWIWIDENLTDASYVISFDGKGGAKMSTSHYVDSDVGFEWSTLSDLTYFIEENLFEIEGKYYGGVKLHIKGEIINLDSEKFEAGISSFIISNTDIGPLGTLTFTKADEDMSYLAGTWRVTYPSLGLINYYIINEDNNNTCYEMDEDGVWQAYQHEKFYCYGDLLIWMWQDSNEPGDYKTVEGYIVDKHEDKLFLVRYNVNLPLSEVVFFEKIDASEIPGAVKHE